MTIDIVVPMLGESVTEATVSKWFKTPGETVSIDEALVELETDKVSIEVNAPSAGILTSIICLLYTSDAADEGLGVDLGGRRII